MPTPLLAAVDLPTASTSEGSGWLYDLLTKAGVSPSTAHTVIEFVWRPLVIVLVLVVAGLIAHFGRRVIRRYIANVATHATARGGSSRNAARMTTWVRFIADLFRAFVLAIALAIVLGLLGINLTPLLASATIIGVTLGFGCQVAIRDYVSGFLLTLEDQFALGDSITIDSVTGVVEDLTLRVTKIRSLDGTLWHVPNGDIRLLANLSRSGARAVVDLVVPINESTHLDEVTSRCTEAASAVAAAPTFAATVTEAPEVFGVVASDATTCTVRVALRCPPIQRDALVRAMREAMVQSLLDHSLWPLPPTS